LTVESVDEDDDDNNDEIDNDMPGLQERNAYDIDSDDEEDEEEGDDEEEEEDDEEQSTGVLDDESTGVIVETVQEEAETPRVCVRTKGVQKSNTTTRTGRRVRQSHLNSDLVYTNYSTSLTHSQSQMTRTTEHLNVMNSLINYGQVMKPGIKNVVNGLLMAQQYHVNKGLKVFGERGREAVMKEMKQLDELEVIKPRNWSELTPEQRRTALPYLMFLTEKRDESIIII
jgi:hypothetical protein